MMFIEYPIRIEINWIVCTRDIFELYKLHREETDWMDQ